jgi:peroxiredoxin
MTRILILPAICFTLLLSAFVACSPPVKTETPAATTAAVVPPQADVPRLKVGDAAPAFTLGDLDNMPVSLSDFAGKKVIINMWMMGCHGCEEELPYLQEFYAKWKEKGVILLGINTSNGVVVVRSYAASSKLSFPLLVDTGKRLNPSYGITGVPTTFFLDGKGIIKAIKDGSFENVAEIEEIYNSY